MDYFTEGISCEELIWRLRRRHQMWAGDRILQLYGVVVGFSLSRKEFDFDCMHRLRSFVEKEWSIATGKSLSEIIEDLAIDAKSENCIFFEMFERFSGAEPSRIETFSAGKKGGRESSRPVGGVREPAFVQLVEFPGRGVYLLFLDELKRRFYEIGMDSFEYGVDFVTREFSAVVVPSKLSTSEGR